MLQNWLKPPASAPAEAPTFAGWQIGKNILRHTGALPDLQAVRVALIGVGEAESDAVRAALYRMACAFPPGTVADLGNVRRATPSVLIGLLNELLAGRILPIVFGAPDELARAQFLAYHDAKALVNLVVVDERLRFDAQHRQRGYAPLLQPRHALLFHFGLIGYQVHQTPATAVDFLRRHHFEALRLGRTGAALEETEPLLRDADLLAFHLAALKQSEAPGVDDATPSGYALEEACQLCRYAGMSDKLSSLGLYGFNHARDRDAQTAQAVGQLIWYFLEGVFSRKNDYPVSKDGLTEYIVELRNHHYHLTFWKSVKSGRWWIQVPVATGQQHERHRLVPCSYQDYQAACRDELPDRLMQAFQRFG
jgi:formiminoglutamase